MHPQRSEDSEGRAPGSDSVAREWGAAVAQPVAEGEEPASPPGAMGQGEAGSDSPSHSRRAWMRGRERAEPGWVRTRPVSMCAACGESRDPS